MNCVFFFFLFFFISIINIIIVILSAQSVIELWLQTYIRHISVTVHIVHFSTVHSHELFRDPVTVNIMEF